jgi:hypothetical protein
MEILLEKISRPINSEVFLRFLPERRVPTITARCFESPGLFGMTLKPVDEDDTMQILAQQKKAPDKTILSNRTLSVCQDSEAFS